MDNIKVIGVDLAKNIFHLVGINKAGKEVARKKFNRANMINYLKTKINSETTVIAMEACASAHHWGRNLTQLGFKVELLPAQHVKGYLRGQKNDFNDAKAIAEACSHGSIRTVAIKSVEQQDQQSFFRIRQQIVKDRVMLVNQTRGLLAEYGVVFPQGVTAFRKHMILLLDAEDSSISQYLKQLIRRQFERYSLLTEELNWYEQQIKQQAKTDENCKRLQEIPGFGPVASTLFSSWLGDGKQFQKGREASAALGIVPKQYSTGGKSCLMGITKRGDKHVRCVVVHGARAVVNAASKKKDALSLWINDLVARRGKNKATVALANKLVRVAWSIVKNQQNYKPSAVALQEG